MARGLQRRGPVRPSRGRAWAAVTRRVARASRARSAHGPKTLTLRARGARARGKKRRAGVLGRRRRPRRENCVRKGGAVPFWGPIGLSRTGQCSHESEPELTLGVWKRALAACKALAQLRLAMDESTFLFTSESVSEGHPGIAYND